MLSRSYTKIYFAVVFEQFGVEAVGFFRMEVVDTGVGLSAEDQKRIFGEFTQFKNSELHGGGKSLPGCIPLCM